MFSVYFVVNDDLGEPEKIIPNYEKNGRYYIPLCVQILYKLKVYPDSSNPALNNENIALPCTWEKKKAHYTLYEIPLQSAYQT